MSEAVLHPFFSRERTIAAVGFNRWLVPPAALAIHLCIGMAYGFSVFWLPLSRALGITQARTCGADVSLIAELFTTSCDWRISSLGWMYTLFFVFLGASAALWGGWLERVGPRKAGVVSAVCWCGGLLISAFGVQTHQLWMLWIGSGVIGGIGLGLGYISPVSTLIKWFPDKRGMATGMAIMGFGGGAMIGAPLADRLMKLFASADSVGVAQTFIVLAGIYFLFMMAGALGYRVPPAGWKPAGWTPSPAKANNTMVTQRHVHVNEAIKTPQFWLIWAVLCLNVSAGIGVLGMASPLLQEVFGGKLLGVTTAFTELTAAQKGQIAAIAAGFTGLLSLFNIGGRFFWASLSDRLGRKLTYAIFFALGFVLYAAIPWTSHTSNIALFSLAFCVILSMYGGGFATVPALPGRHVRHPDGGRHPRPPADRMVDGRHSGPGAGELPARIPDRPRRGPRGRLRHHDDGAGRPAGARLHLQPAGASGRSEALHDRSAARRATPRRGRRHPAGRRAGNLARVASASGFGRGRGAGLGRSRPAVGLGGLDYTPESRRAVLLTRRTQRSSRPAP